jgi:phenylalanyl-tRNA synthetase beta chain
MPKGLERVEVDDERRAHEPALRPSVLVGLLSSRRVNRNARVEVQGGIRLFETGSVFAQQPGGASVENVNVAMLVDCPFAGKTAGVSDIQQGLRTMKGAIGSLVRALAGPAANLEFVPGESHCAAIGSEGYASLLLNGQRLGYVGVVSPAVLGGFDLETPVVGAELSLAGLIAAFPARSKVHALPAFPAIERDISFIVAETVAYSQVEAGVRASKVPWLEGCGFVGTYRGKQIGAGKKSVTLRLVFRDAERTLRHEEIDAPAAAVVSHLKAAVGAEVREA